MTVDFSDYFWGEGQKNNGLEVLFQNVKYGVTTAKEVADFLKERSTLEESHSKALNKLGKLASNGCPNGSFSPMWQVLKNLSEKLSSAHSQMVQKIEELVKELLRYAEELQKQYKTVKDGESGSLEAVQVYQNAKSMVSKTKAIYMQRYLELEKCQKESAPQKELEKAEGRMKKAQEEYKTWVEKYQASTEDYVSKMTESCRRFQDVEVFYLEKVKEFMDTYASVMDSNHQMVGQVHTEFRSECDTLTTEELLQQFVRQKATGNTRPSVNLDLDDTLQQNLEINHSTSSEDKSSTAPTMSEKVLALPSEKIFEGNNDPMMTASMPLEVNQVRSGNKGSRRTTSLLNLFIPQSQGKSNNAGGKGVDSPTSVTVSLSVTGTGVDLDNPTLSRSSNRGSKWFLRSRRGKKKEKKGNKDNKKEDSGVSTDALENESSAEANACANSSGEVVSSPKVDAEGFTIRPKDVWEAEDNGKFYSSSDTDSEEEPGKRLHVEIKPLANGTAPLSASVDELRTTVENLTAAGLASRKAAIEAENQNMKRSQSVSQQIGAPASSPPPRYPYAPLSPAIPANNNTIPASKPSPGGGSTLNPNDSTYRYADLGDLFAEVGEMQPAIPPKSRTTPTSGGTMSIPRPPSRPRPEIPLFPQRANTNSPSPVVSRADSVASLETRSVGSHIGSRGPSPLTLGMSDLIPIAVAFHEIVHAYFKGNDENKCKVKMTGDMMISFPAGIIQVFANNPSPAQLHFQVRSKQGLERLICNKNLVQVETLEDVLHFEFDMSALIILLKSHAEQNPNASYFNVDILKYQIKPKPGAVSCPLHLVAFWKCETQQTDLRIDYKYNCHAMEALQSEVVSAKNSPSSSSSSNSSLNSAPLSQVCIAAPVDGGVKTMQSKPSGQWFTGTNRACWKLSTMSTKSENQGVGSLRARFDVSSGPSSNGTIAAQFSCENSTLSGCDFELLGSGYRVSLVKKRFVSGKYICDAEENSNRYSVPPEYSKPVHL